MQLKDQGLFCVSDQPMNAESLRLSIHVFHKVIFLFVQEHLKVCFDNLSIDYGIVIIHLPDIINCYI